MSFTTITQQQKTNIKNKTPYALPDRPTEAGYSPAQIKEKQYKAIIDEADQTNSIIGILENLITEANTILATLQTKSDSTSDKNDLENQINAKLSKLSPDLSTPYRVYVSDGFGNNLGFQLDFFGNKIALSVPFRNGNGSILFPLPQADDEAANKKYVDNLKVTSITQLTTSNNIRITLTYGDLTTKSIDIPTSDLLTAIGVATDSASGYMSSSDHTKLTTLYSALTEDNTAFIDNLQEILQIFANYPEGTDILTILATKVDKTFTIAGIDLQDNITTLELQTALGIDTINTTLGNKLNKSDYLTDEEIEDLYEVA